ncbi:hypothetical protein I6N95_22200 [Vagococcus sp. BWB3-3]|uniref:Uncharacterized protein n=1 Tax=Vagococcus allomyrinae TaxID=2794353 RepID=A0A940P9Y6_9ENTE|nr:YusW family protein [Vagococcus allomyrinae]MBP1043745.1 hypothetical protein [Vagococcus allomyrinae]
MKSIKKLMAIAAIGIVAGIGLTTTADAAITSDVKEVDVEIKYGKSEVEFEYEVKSYGVQASYKNELTGERLSGNAARNKIEALMANVNIKTDSRETIAQAIASQISTQSYTKFEFETEYTNRQTIKFNLTGAVTTPPTTTPTAIKEFEVELKYGNKKVEIDYEVKNNSVKAKYYNQVTGEYLTGTQAQTKIESIMNGMDFKGASRTQIVSYITNALGTGSNYSKFEFEASYTNKAKIEFEIKK